MAALRLLMAGFASTGLLLLDLPASAQLSGDISTFNGEVAATCSFESLRDSYSMIYYDSVNYLRSSAYFEVATNLPSIRVGVSQVTTITESVGLNGAAIDVDARFYQRDSSGRSFLRATATKSSSATTESLDMSVGNRVRLDAVVFTANRVGSLYQIGPGEYSYTVTISCLL